MRGGHERQPGHLMGSITPILSQLLHLNSLDPEAGLASVQAAVYYAVKARGGPREQRLSEG